MLIKRLLERQAVFSSMLCVLAFLGRRPFWGGVTNWLTSLLARTNVFLNRPKKTSDVAELAHTWKALMPPDGQEYFEVSRIEGETAYTKIHLECPLRGSNDAHACYKLMNYDRQLMDQVGGQLIVLESQSNSGKPYCRLAIRKKGADVDDLVPAHIKAFEKAT